MVDPILTCDSWRASFIDRPPQSEVGQGVKILLGGLLSFFKTEDFGTDFLDFREVLVIQLKLSCLESSLRRSSRGCSLSVIGFQLLLYLGGSGTSLELLVMGLLPRFLSLWEILTLRPRGGCSFSGVGSSVLSQSVLEASVTHSWTCCLVFEVLGTDSFGSNTSGSGPQSSG